MLRQLGITFCNTALKLKVKAKCPNVRLLRKHFCPIFTKKYDYFLIFILQFHKASRGSPSRRQFLSSHDSGNGTTNTTSQLSNVKMAAHSSNGSVFINNNNNNNNSKNGGYRSRPVKSYKYGMTLVLTVGSFICFRYPGTFKPIKS